MLKCPNDIFWRRARRVTASSSSSSFATLMMLFCHHLRSTEGGSLGLRGHAVSGQPEIGSRKEGRRKRRKDEERGESERIPLSLSDGLRVEDEGKRATWRRERERERERESALLNREQNMFLRREILQVPPLPSQSSKAAAERRGEGEADA